MSLHTAVFHDKSACAVDHPLCSPVRHLPAEVLAGATSRCSDRDAFVRSWSRLPVDPHMHDGGTYRRRRYARFNLIDDELIVQPHIAFFQPTDINAVNGGTPRVFAPIEADVAGSATLRGIVLALRAVVPGALLDDDIAVGVHQIRITATATDRGLPTPEGIHRDGHSFVGQVLIHRGAVTGGASTIYDPDGAPILHRTLREPFEAIVIDDRRVLHGVGVIEPAGSAAHAVRDMLLVDFFSLLEVSA